MSTENMVNNDKFVILPVGLNVGSSTVNESLLIRGFEDGSKAINFDNWLLPFDDVTKALHIKTTTLNDGQLELRSPGLVTRINPQELKTAPELGLVISVGEIKKIGVPSDRLSSIKSILPKSDRPTCPRERSLFFFGEVIA